jgi:hypothetical protein
MTLAVATDAFSPAPILGTKAALGWAGMGRGSSLLAKVKKDTGKMSMIGMMLSLLLSFISESQNLC